MDFSTISNKTGCTEFEELTNGELSERYYLLKKQFENLSRSYETTKQDLHDTRRSYQTALDVQSHLNAELEALQSDEARRRSELNSRITLLQEEISVLKLERSETSDRYANELKKFEKEIVILKEQQVFKTRESPERDNTELEETRSALSTALSDAANFKTVLEEARQEICSWKLKVEELMSELAEMRESANIRREEMKAANEREMAALADLAEARAMLHQYAEPQEVQPHAAKGNSIFAEVEDKRQEMAKNLIQMKNTNSRLRRELANKQAELDALLQEKHTVWEQQAGASAHYDRELIENYEARITQLEALCERQRREQSKWFNKLCEPTSQGWLPGVMDHLRSECERLRAEVLCRGAAQLASAAQLRDLRRKIAVITANNAIITNSPTADYKPIESDIKSDIGMLKHNVLVKTKSNHDDVKKKVSFN